MASRMMSLSWVLVGVVTSAYMTWVSNFPVLQVSSCEVFDTGIDCNESLLSYFGPGYIAVVVLVVALCVTAALRGSKRVSYTVSALFAILWLIGIGESVVAGTPNALGILGFILPTVALAFLLSIFRSRMSIDEARRPYSTGS